MLQNTTFKKFEMKNLPLLVDVVEPLWSPPIGDKKFKRFNVEFIVRMNIFENDRRFEFVDSESGEFLSAAFLAKKGDSCKAEEWFKKESECFPENLKTACYMSKTYLELMDRQTFSLMKDDDIKLSLFVSRKSGTGKPLLSNILEILKTEGFKNIYLWTDCECNWEWYVTHGFTLVQEKSYEPFSSETVDYKTYIFKKKID